jgi:2-iminoacetate synthase ThiH
MMEYINHIISKRSQNELLNATDIQTLYHFAIQSSENYQYIIDKAAGIKHRHFSDEIELYVPIYISSICRNNCTYCDFRIDNESLDRRVLNDEQYLHELDFLLERGHRFIEIVGGEGNFDDFLRKVRLTRERLDRFDNTTLASFPGVYGTKVSAAPMKKPASPVSDRQLILQVALCRIAFPQSYIMLSTREDMDMLMRMIDAGANLINAEASTSPGGYTNAGIDNEEQFRHYSYHIDEVTPLLSNKGHRPVCKMDKDAQLLEFSSFREDTIDSYSL